MQRYAGEPLGDAPHLVVLGSCKVGNFVVSTPVLSGLKNRFPGSILGFIGSDVTADFENAHPAIDWRCSWDKQNPQAGLALFNEIERQRALNGPFSLAINLDGFNPVTCSLASWLAPIYVAGGSLNASRRSPLPWGELPQQVFLNDPDWDSEDFQLRHRRILRTNYIAELFAQLAFVGDFCDPAEISLPSEAPSFSVPDILIHTTTARSAKIWPFERWKTVIDYATQSGWSVGLIGSAPKLQQELYRGVDGEQHLLESTQLIDLRGRTSLIQLAGACAQARAVISVDAGPLHISAAMGTPTLAVVGNDAQGTGASPIRLWLPRRSNVTRTVSDMSCDLCSSNRFRNEACIADRHQCMLGVSSQQVIDWLRSVITT